VRRLSEEKETRFRALVKAHGIEPLPGARDWVARLHADGWAQAIATSAPRANLEAMVGAMKMGRYFGAGVAAEDVTHGKPHPEVFLVAAHRLGVEPSRSVVVEDAPIGIEAGRRAGMSTVGVSLLHALPDADVCVGTLPELPDDTFETLLKRVGEGPRELPRAGAHKSPQSDVAPTERQERQHDSRRGRA
jgi:beta-phosphoglucomutase